VVNFRHKKFKWRGVGVKFSVVFSFLRPSANVSQKIPRPS